MLVPADPNISTTLLGETWEAPVEAGAVPAQPGAGGGRFEVASVSIAGDNHLYANGHLQVDVTFTGTTAGSSALEIHILPSSGLGPPLDPPYIVFQQGLTPPFGATNQSFVLWAQPGLPPSGSRTVVVSVKGSAVTKSTPFLLRG